MRPKHKNHRGTIHIENCRVVAHENYAGGQKILRLHSEKMLNAKAGQFVFLQVSADIALRRPMSIMKIDREKSTFDILYKILGAGTKALGERKINDQLSVMGPIGNGFSVRKKRPLLIGGGVGIPPVVLLAGQIKNGDFENNNFENDDYAPFAVLGSELPFAFLPIKSALQSRFPKPGSTMPILEKWGIPARLASRQKLPDALQGFATDIAEVYLQNLTTEEMNDVEIFACGPDAMLRAVFDLAKKYALPCQLSLEEYMACAVGGCAGCTVMVNDGGKKSMKRVCVDGPVFEARRIFA